MKLHRDSLIRNQQNASQRSLSCPFFLGKGENTAQKPNYTDCVSHNVPLQLSGRSDLPMVRVHFFFLLNLGKPDWSSVPGSPFLTARKVAHFLHGALSS